MLTEKVSQMANSPIKALIYGASAIGKTTQIGTLVQAGFNPIVISAENGMESLRKLVALGIDVDFINITLDKDRNLLPRGLPRINRIKEIYTELMNDPKARRFDTVCLDTLTEIADALLDSAREEEMAKEKSDMRRYWGQFALDFMKLTYAFRDLPYYNTIMFCQEDLDKDETTGRRSYGPEIPGKAAQGPLRASLDIVYRLAFNDEGKRVFQTNLTPNVYAKHRGSRLELFEDAEFETGGLGALLKRIKEGR